MINTQTHIKDTLKQITQIKRNAISKAQQEFNKTPPTSKDIFLYQQYAKKYLRAHSHQKRVDLQLEYLDKLDFETEFNLTKYLDLTLELVNLYKYSFLNTSSTRIVDTLTVHIKKGLDHNPILDTTKALYDSVTYYKRFAEYLNLTAPDQSNPHYWVNLTG